MGTQLPSPKRAQPPIFGPYPLRPNSCIDQDATWYAGRPRPRPTLCSMGTLLPSPKKMGQSPQIVDPCLLWPNGWMDQDRTWHGGIGLSPGDLVVLDGDPAPVPKKGAEPPPQFSAHFYCGQTAGCTKMPLGMELRLSPGDFVLDGDTAPPQKGGGAPAKFSAHVYCAKRLDASRCHLVCR